VAVLDGKMEETKRETVIIKYYLKYIKSAIMLETYANQMTMPNDKSLIYLTKEYMPLRYIRRKKVFC